MSRYSPESQFILDCLRSNFQQDQELQIDSCLNWDAILETAFRHRVIPHLFQAMRSQQMPVALREQYDCNALNSLKLAGELKRILAILPVAAIPFKGPVLAFQTYGNLSSRQFDDLDLLINVEDYPLAKVALLENGYALVDRLSPLQESAFLESQHHCQFFNKKLGTILEVHWKIAPKIYSFALSVSDLFERADVINAFGQDVLTLSREDTMLVLSEHGARHYWSRLEWICDIARLCQSELDWQEILDRAKSLGILRSTHLAVSLARDFLGMDVPELHLFAGDKNIHPLAKDVKDRIFEKFIHTDPHIERFYIRSRERKRDKFRYYVYRAVLPTQEDWASIDLPSSLFPLYSLIRPLRLINKYGSEVVKWLR
ncbi:MAG: nucleotidyltransferase family protein [Methanothrix sp.]|nr:nucleotidyltransferase family protein [Methanothrix sp.]